MNRALNIIGISAHFHDSACCLIRNGKLLWAAEEERFSRKKHDPGIPWRAFRACLQENGISLPEVDCIAYYEDPVKKLARQIYTANLPETSPKTRSEFLGSLPQLGRAEREIRVNLGYEGPIRVFNHHHSHAASAFFFSGFEEAAVLTTDGVGEWATTALGRANRTGIEFFEEVHFPHSLGFFYSAITAYLGFRVNNDEYKVMGLAPYGEARYVNRMYQIIQSRERGRIQLNTGFFDFLKTDRMYSDRFIALFGQPPRQPESELEQFHKDIAKSAQVVLEEILIEKVRYLHSRVPGKNLCMAGGVALNCVANGRIRREGPFANVFIQPASSDSGGALGAAALAYLELSGTAVNERMENSCLGPGFSSSEIVRLLEGTSVQYLEFCGNPSAHLDEVTDRLAAGKVVGWFHGRMEFGPRALGSRSILADPRDPGMRDRINSLVKKREAFRPFAPAVLKEEASNHFQMDHASPFMLETCKVISELELPAITHVDGSARVQTVDSENGGRFYRLLKSFYKKTGCPILLNTSFNMRGEPIVCTPLDAILCFVRSRIDVLVLEDLIIDRENIPDHWYRILRHLPDPSQSDPVVSHLIYTLL